MREANQCLCIVAVMAALFTGGGVFAAPTGFDDAIADYNVRRYSQALTKLQQYARGKPTDALARYYMALCYQALNQISMAQQEYTWVYNNAQDPALRYNAGHALQNIQRWSQNRAYNGQGNDFSYRTAGPAPPRLPNSVAEANACPPSAPS